MCDTRQPRPFTFDPITKATTDMNIDSCVIPGFGVGDNKAQLMKSDISGYLPLSDPRAFSKTNIPQYKNKTFVTLRMPEVSGLFNSRIRNIDPEVKYLLSQNTPFKIIINSIFNLLDHLLSDKGYAYHVDIKYRTLGDFNKTYISVYLENANFDEALARWKESNDMRIELFKLLEKEFGDVWPNNKIDDVRRSIGVEFDAGDR